MGFKEAGIPDEKIYQTLSSSGVQTFNKFPTAQEMKDCKFHFFEFERDGIEKGDTPSAFIERINVLYVFPSGLKEAPDLTVVLDALILTGLQVRDSDEGTIKFKDTQKEYTTYSIIVTRPRMYLRELKS